MKLEELCFSGKQNKSTEYILVFDSGMGGLSIFDEVHHVFPNENYIYIFDNEAFPYGEKTDQFLIDRVVGIISQASQKYSIKLVIIACNTASTIVLPALRKSFNFPFIGVVPAIKPATLLTNKKKIGILVTKATSSRKYLFDLIDEFAKDIEVSILGSENLAKIAEKKLQGFAPDEKELKNELSLWLNDENPPDVIVLGCTHYPLLKKEISAIFSENLIFLDSGKAIANRVAVFCGTENQSLKTEEKSKKIVMCTLLNDEVKKMYKKVFEKRNFCN